ncbi:MAG: hypothetical protein KGL38_07015, partial [Gemmatimonadota bacterium]|nr:hypothetical protein [Gemmatimonadota bacterium]
AEVRGTWVTDAARYRGRALVIGERSISFQAGAAYDDMSSHIIRRVARQRVPDGMLFDVEYVDGSVYDPPGVIQFIYRDGPTPELMLAHQTQIVWHLETAGR